MYINAVANNVTVQLYLGYDFYNKFLYKNELYRAPGFRPTPPPKMKNSGCAPYIKHRLRFTMFCG